MKHLFIISLLVLCINNLQAQDTTWHTEDSIVAPLEDQVNYIFAPLNMSEVSTHRLIDRTLQFLPVKAYDGKCLTDTNQVDWEAWRKLHYSISWAATDPIYRLTDPDSLYDHSQCNDSSLIPIGLLHFEYQRFDDSSLVDSLIYIDNGQYFDVAGRSRSPYLLSELFAASTMMSKVEKTNLKFILPRKLYVSNVHKIIREVLIDFDDGLGYRPVLFDVAIPVIYLSQGQKIIRIKLIYEGGLMVQSHSPLMVGNPEHQRYSSHFRKQYFKSKTGRTSSTAWLYRGFGCGNGNSIKKPLIVVDGFDPAAWYGNNNTYEKFIGTMPLEIKNMLENDGYDLIYVDFDGYFGSEYIQRNAYLLEEIIDWANAQKASNFSTEQNVVMGISMGGLIAKYALRDMEIRYQNGTISKSHDTREYISFDVPHQGANALLGAQQMLDHVANTKLFGLLRFKFLFTELEDAYKTMNSPAAKQMLILQKDRTEYFNFYNELNAMGDFTSIPKTLAISNGSENGQGQTFSPGAELIKLNESNWALVGPFWGTAVSVLLGTNIYVSATVKAVPDNGNSSFKTYNGFIFATFAWLPAVVSQNTGYAFSGEKPYDSAPGGVVSSFKGSVGNVPGLTLSFNHFCFMPSVSSLNIKSPTNQNLYVNIRNENIIATNKTSFKSYTALSTINSETGTQNETHTELTLDNLNLFRTDLVSFDVNANQSATLENTTFNYGKNSNHKTHNRIIDGIVVKNNGFLTINKNRDIGYTNSNMGNPNSNAPLIVSTNFYNCNAELYTISIENGGTLEIGDPVNPNAYSASLNIIYQNTLRIANGGKLIINDNSILNIDNNATLIFEPGASIELRGPNAVLELYGNMTLLDNTTFTFTGNGFIRCKERTSIVAGKNCNFILSGTDRYDVLLELDKDCIFGYPKTYTGGAINPFENYTIENGTVYMETGAQLRTGKVSYIDNVIFSSLSGEKNGHLGLAMLDNSELLINNSLFEYGEYGIYSISLKNSYPVIQNSIIRYCNKGIYTWGGALSMYLTELNENGIGWQAVAPTIPAHVYNSKFFSNVNEGIHYEGAVNAMLNIGNNSFSQSQLGVFANGSTNIKAYCNGWYNNQKGIHIGNNTILNMSNSLNGGNNTFFKNNISIGTQRAKALQLNQGNNSLIANGTAADINGTIQQWGYKSIVLNPELSHILQPVNVPGGPIIAAFNQWNSSNLPPIENVDYQLTSTYNNGPVNILDASPVNKVGSCTGGGGGIGIDGIKCLTCTKINTTDFKNVLLVDAVNTAISVSLTDDAKGINLFKQILTYDKYSHSTQEQYYLDLAYSQMQDALGKLYAEDKPVTTSTSEVIEVINYQLNELSDVQENYLRKFYLNIEKAQVYRLANNHLEALTVLNALDSWVKEEDNDYYSLWKCIINTELDMIAGNAIEREPCNIFYAATQESRLIPKSVDEIIPYILEFKVYPNPQGDGISIVELHSPDEEMVDIILQDISGKEILIVAKNKLLNKGQNRFTYDSSAIAPGVYMMRVKMNNKQLTKKVIILR